MLLAASSPYNCTKPAGLKATIKKQWIPLYRKKPTILLTTKNTALYFLQNLPGCCKWHKKNTPTSSFSSKASFRGLVPNFWLRMEGFFTGTEGSYLIIYKCTPYTY